MEDESEGAIEEKIVLRHVILVRSSRRDNSADFPSQAAAGEVRGPISSGEFGLWRGSPSEILLCGESWPIEPGSWSDHEINSQKNMEEFTVGDCGEAAIPNLRFKIKMWKGEPESDNFRSLPEDK